MTIPRSRFHSGAAAWAAGTWTRPTRAVARRPAAAPRLRLVCPVVDVAMINVLPGCLCRCRDQDAGTRERVAGSALWRASPTQGDGRPGAGLRHDELGGDAVAHLGDVTDHADHAATVAQGVEGVHHVIEGVGVEGAEALVDEERVERGPADLVH